MDNTNAYKHKNFYDAYAIDLSKIYYSKIIEDAEQLFASPAKMLDIGCYDGTLGEVFLKKGWSVHGIEAHGQACLEAGRKGLDVLKRNIEEGLPYPENTFDLVVAAEIIEHLYDTDEFLENIKRILKPQGVLILTVPNVACLANRVGLLLGKYPRLCEYQAGKAGGHIRVYTKKALMDQLCQHDFQPLKCRGANLPCPMGLNFIPKFVKKMAVRLGDFTPSIAGQIIVASRNLK